MIYKTKQIKRQQVLENYYKNREKRIKYQREYDKRNKEKKREYDKLRRKKKNYKKIKRIQKYSSQHHFPKLIKQICKCQLCGSRERLEIHHKRYTKKLDDCMLLCQECHKKIHRKFVGESY